MMEIQDISFRNEGRYEWRSFLQQSSHSDDAPRKVVHNLRVLARKHKDAALVQIASRMSVTVSAGSKTGEDLFAELNT